mgnify:FL=1
MKSMVDLVVDVLDEACWDSHRQVGYKMKGGKRVPNCVPKNEEKDDDGHTKKVKQDPTVADEPGTQPAKYYKGLSKSEKESRAKHFAKGGSESPAPGDKDAKTKPSKHTQKYKKMFGEENIEEAIEGLKNKSEKSGISYGVLKKVYDRGMAAWKGGHRPGTTPQQWAFARVNSFITKGKGTWGGADSDLAGKVRKEQLEVDEARGEDSKGHFRSTEGGAGMTKAGVAAYRRDNPGSKLQTAVTGKAKAGSKDAGRRKSFCARMSGMKFPMKDEKGRPTRKAMSLKRWKC